MSIKVTSIVWEKSKHKGSALLLMLAIADFAHDDGTGAWPSVEVLAGKTRLSRRNVQVLLRQLVEGENPELCVEIGAGPYRSNAYSINIRTLVGERNLCTVQPSVKNSEQVTEKGTQEGTSERQVAPNPLYVKRNTENVKPVPVPEPPVEKSNLFTLYENNIGLLTPLMSDELKEWEKEFPAAWFPDAFSEALKQNVRKPKYIRAILDRWKSEGRGSPRQQSAQSPPSVKKKTFADIAREGIQIREGILNGKSSDG